MGLRNDERRRREIAAARAAVHSAALTVAWHRRHGQLTHEHLDELQSAVADYDTATRAYIVG